MKLDKDELLLQILLNSGMLSITTMILLGSASKPFEKLVRPATCHYMKTWKDSLESKEENLLVAEEDEVNTAVFKSREVFEGAEDNLERKRSRFKGNSLLYRVLITLETSVPLNRGDDLNRYFELREADQGGPIFGTGVHIAAMLGDVGLCHLLWFRGADVNANIFIPNDQDSWDKSQEAANRDDGSDFSQYRWGLVTPLRLAITYGQDEVCCFLKTHNGIAGTATVTENPEVSEATIGSVFATSGRPGFRYLPPNSCWTNADDTEILYLNTYMHGERVYPGVLFERGDQE